MEAPSRSVYSGADRRWNWNRLFRTWHKPGNVVAGSKLDHHPIPRAFRSVIFRKPLPEAVSLYPDNGIFLVVEVRPPPKDLERNDRFFELVLAPEQNFVAEVLQQACVSR